MKGSSSSLNGEMQEQGFYEALLPSLLLTSNPALNYSIFDMFFPFCLLFS